MAAAASNHYLIRAAAPLVFGTGRPLDFGLGGESLSFPFPSTLAGAARAAAAVAAGEPPDPFRERDGTVLGPSGLVALNSDLLPQHLLFARPADAVFIGGKVLPLRPGSVPEGCWTDLPAGLLPLELSEQVDGKPDKAAPWWTAQQIQDWLAAPAKPAISAFKGNEGLKEAARTHVVIEEGGAGGAEQGGLFRTTGQDFGPPRRKLHEVASAPPAHSGGHALWISTSAAGLDGQARRLGGEGRLARLERMPTPELPRMPPMSAQEKKRVRFVLVTPAVFARGGWCPDWLPQPGDGDGEPTELVATVPGTSVKLRLVAAAIARAQSYSGWQPDGQGRAGPGQPHRVVPAGSVYWFDVLEGDVGGLHGRSLCEGRWLNDGWGYGLIGKGGTGA